MKKLLSILVLLVFFLIPSKNQTIVGQKSSDIIDYYNSKGFEFDYTPFMNKSTGKEELCLVLNENEYGGKEVIYLNSDYICYLHLYMYDGKDKYKEWKKTTSKKGKRLSNKEIDLIINAMVKDSTHYSSEEKVQFKKNMWQMAKKDRHMKIENMLKIKKGLYIHQIRRLFWEVIYDKKQDLTVIKIY